MVKTISNHNNVEITLMPNRSLSATQNQWLVFFVCTFIFIVALFWSMQGAFFVLPFAGLDIVLFAYFMFKINRKCLRKQLITIDSNKVLIQSGLSKVEHAQTLSRDDAFIVFSKEHEEKNLKLKISDSKTYCEIGSFLTTNDKMRTRKVLLDMGLREVNEQWWKASINS